MKLKNKIGIFYRGLFALAAAAAFAGLVIYTDEVRQTAGKAAEMCIEMILPSLFPFLVLSNFVIGMGYVRVLGKYLARPMRRLFNLSGACAGPFLMGIIGGYPIGAKSAAALFESGQCSKTECERMLSFCNNSGPAFIFGVVGSGVFSDPRTGFLLYAAHVLASVTVGIIFRFYKRHDIHTSRHSPMIYEQPHFSSVFTNSITQALTSIGGISAFVIFFAVSTDLIFSSGVLPLLERAIRAILSPFGITGTLVRHALVGLLEMTSGLGELSGSTVNMGSRLCMAAFMLGWAGISVHCQVLSFISSANLSLKPYFAGKLLHGILSAVYMRLFLASSLSSFTAAASVQAQMLASVNPRSTVIQSALGCAAVIFAAFLPRLCKLLRRKI